MIGGNTATNGFTWPDLISALATEPKWYSLYTIWGLDGWPGSIITTGYLRSALTAASYCGGSQTSAWPWTPEAVPSMWRVSTRP